MITRKQPFARHPAARVVALCALLFLLLTSAPRATGQPEPVAVDISVLADSLNSVHARITVPPGTNAKALMQRLFQIEFADATERFVKGICGFQADGRKREYWSLEINGTYAEVGIADVRITRSMSIRWQRRKY